MDGDFFEIFVYEARLFPYIDPRQYDILLVVILSLAEAPK